MTDPFGVNLLPACNEWVYDTLPHRAARVGESAPQEQNRYAQASNLATDCSLAIDQLQAACPACKTVSLVCAWFGNSIEAGACKIYPSTTFIGGSAQVYANGAWSAEDWMCSGLTQASPGLIPISQSNPGSFVYGGTPSDPSIVRCIRDLKARGFRVTFYPFILMDCVGFPWRGRIAYAGADISAAATSAVNTWLGTATAGQFARDAARLTVGYSGAPTDWTFRRMILHYANLCVIAGGVDLFLIGSELRGLESVRGPAWTKAGATQSDGTVTWDYPFVAGLARLAGDVRGVFDAAGLTKDTTNLRNLIAYSPDWSSWMGLQHAEANGQWPHLDQLFASPDIDLVSFDNYLPLSDWTTGNGGLDFANWSAPAPTSWPPSIATMSGLGLPQPPMLATKAYLKANVEGGEAYNWYYRDGGNLGRGWDPLGSAQQVSRPTGDRLAQARSPYYPGQELLANKQLRWWWNNSHHAVYDAGDGQGWGPRGPSTKWVPQSKPITFAEYGFPTTDRCTNQPNVFYDPKSSESFTPYWSAWESADGGATRPVRDDTLASLARDAIVEYWTVDGHNATSAADVKMIEPAFMCAWNWDARPFPTFPQSATWGDATNWRVGTWIEGKGPSTAPKPPDPTGTAASRVTAPTLAGLGWSLRYQPGFATDAAEHVSGRETRAGRNAAPLWESIVYTPYAGNVVSLWNGSTFVATSFAEVSQSFSDATKSPSAAAAGNVYDVFAWSDGGTFRVTRGPAWSAGATAGSNAARGGGAGSTALTRVNGILVNQFAITNGPGAGFGTYLGTIATDAGAATVSWTLGSAASGGGAAWLGVWNMYHRRQVGARVTDSGPGHAYASSTQRPYDNSLTMRITMVAGLSEDTMLIGFSATANIPSGAAAHVAIGIDSAAAPTYDTYQYVSAGGILFSESLPTATLAGLHYYQMMESVGGTGTVNYTDANYAYLFSVSTM